MKHDIINHIFYFIIFIQKQATKQTVFNTDNIK